eukprot:1314706-Pyramimonas_sp.AAC.1
MRPSDARSLHGRIQNSSRYVEKPHDLMSDFVQDKAAICATRPNMTQRKASNNATVLNSLEHAATARELGHIQNVCKYAATQTMM